MAKEKRLIIRPVPRSAGEIPNDQGPPIKFDQIDLGIGATPRFIVVLRGKAARDAMPRLSLDGGFPDNMAGSPIVWLPEGAGIEVYEVEQ